MNKGSLLIMFAGVLAIVAITVGCGSSEPTQTATVEPDSWNEQDAVAALASTLFQDAQSAYEAAVERDPSLINNPSLRPQREPTAGWNALRSSDGSWLVGTGTETYRLFEDGRPLILVTSATPTVAVAESTATSTVSASTPIIDPTSTAVIPENTPVAAWQLPGIGLSDLRCIDFRPGVQVEGNPSHWYQFLGNLENLTNATSIVQIRVQIIDAKGGILFEDLGPAELLQPNSVSEFGFRRDFEAVSDGFTCQLTFNVEEGPANEVGVARAAIEPVFAP